MFTLALVALRTIESQKRSRRDLANLSSALVLFTNRVSEVALPPFSQRLQHRAQTLSLFSEVVLHSGRMIAVKSPADEAVFFHSFQAGG